MNRVLVEYFASITNNTDFSSGVSPASELELRCQELPWLPEAKERDILFPNIWKVCFLNSFPL